MRVATVLNFAISIHALREEGDASWNTASGQPGHFYPRPPRGGRPNATTKIMLSENISIHALREEGDSTFLSLTGYEVHFYPRPPRGGRLNHSIRQ